MSSAVISTSAALGRPFLFDSESELEVPLSEDRKPSSQSPIAQGFESTINNQKSTIFRFGNRQSAIENAIVPASRLEIRPTPEIATSGIPALDALIGGLPRGCLTELCGPASSGRTSVMLAALAAATRRGEYCAVIDASDTLDLYSLCAVGADLDRLLWIRADEAQSKGDPSLSRFMRQNGGFDISRNKPERPRESHKTPKNYPRPKFQFEHRLEQVLRATDLLLESGGFGLILLDLADIPYQSARRIPLTTWFRFRRAVEHKPTILLAIEQQPIAGSCSSLQLRLGSQNSSDITPHSQSHAHLLTGLEIRTELIRSRLDRKPARSVAFETKTAWAG